MVPSSCLKCSASLKQLSVAVPRRWRRFKDARIFGCSGCKARWLYAASLTVPVLLAGDLGG